jgi:hypothetical protein
MALVMGVVALRFATEVYCWHVSGGKEMYGKVGDLLVTMPSAWVTGNHRLYYDRPALLFNEV